MLATTDRFVAKTKLRLLAVFSHRFALAVAFGGIFYLLGASAFAQQRIIVEKASGNIVDVGDKTLQYDSRYFDNMDVDVSPIPAGADVKKYMRDSSGAIVLKPKEQLVASFSDEWRNDITSRITAMRIPDDLKALLIEIVKNVRR